jgi:hypothetical protein
MTYVELGLVAFGASSPRCRSSLRPRSPPAFSEGGRYRLVGPPSYALASSLAT